MSNTNQNTFKVESKEAEYALIRKDLYRVLFINLIFLVAILALYFTNAKSHYLDNWFVKIFHF